MKRQLSFLLSLGLLFYCGSLMAQVAGNGVIQGTITDPSGAVIPGATVTATNTATAVKMTRTTTKAGFYVLSPIAPGEYTVTVEKAGFQRTAQEHVTVNALAVVGLNIVLKVGAVTQHVTVTAAPPPLDTTNGTLGVTISNKAYTNLPLAMNNGPKNPEGFIYLLPGVQNGSGFVGNINGGEAFSKEIYINGMPLVTSELQGDYRNLVNMTSTEVVNEFQVNTTGSPAYYEGQGVENYAFKSGGNQYHGDLYEYMRNTSLDARGFFSPTVPLEIQNEFGVSVGGPVTPFLKNKVWFFTNYDGYRLRTGASPTFYSLPTAAERNGDFSALLPSEPIYDPATTACNAAGICTRSAFPGNIIPSSQFSSVSKVLQSELPATINNAVQNNFLGALTSGTDQNDYTIRVDAALTSKDHIYGVTQYGKNAPVGLGPNGGPQLPLPYTSSRFGSTITRLAQLNNAFTISPTVVNVFAFSYNSFYTPFTNPTTGGGWAAKAGLTGLPPGQASDVFPPINFGGPNSPTTWSNNTYTQSFFDKTNTYVFQDNVQFVKGKHSLTVGGQIITEQENVAQPSAGSTLFGINFSNAETAAFNPDGTINTATGNSYASYLLGAVDSSGFEQDAAGTIGARYKNYAFYAQDDFRATPKLTLNLGLRYEVPKPDVEDFNRMSWLNPTMPNSAVNGFPGALQFAGFGPDSCLCRTIVKTHYLDFAPRVGFAYELNHKTVIRASYGVYYYNAGALGGNAQSGGISLLGYAATPSFNTPNGGITPGFYWDSGFPGYTHAPFFDPTLSTGFNTTTGPTGGGISYGDPLLGGIAPRTQNWNFTVERQLTPTTVMNVSYAGSNSHFLPTGIGRGIYADQILPQYAALGNLLTATATPANLAAADAIIPGIGLPYASFNGSIGQALLPWPQYSGVGDNFPDIGNSNFNSMQMAIQRHFSKGLQFLVSYTVGKEIDDAGSNLGGFFGAGGRTAYNNKLEKAVGLQDIPQDLVFSYVYELPFGKGHSLGSSNKVVSALVSGWQFSGIQSYIEGTPTGPVGANCFLPYLGSCYANYAPGFSGSAYINGSYGNGNLLGPNPTKFLNINAFAEPGNFAYGNTPRTLAYELRNTWGLNESFDLQRTFQIKENLSFQFRVDAFDAFNRIQFGAPNQSINSSAFGTIGGQANVPRQFQLEGYFTF